MAAENIDQVINRLDEIIAVARAEENRLGYFPALYRNVTIQVKTGIEEGFFEDGARMERLDVVFANCYLDALAQYRQGMATRFMGGSFCCVSAVVAHRAAALYDRYELPHQSRFGHSIGTNCAG